MGSHGEHTHHVGVGTHSRREALGILGGDPQGTEEVTAIEEQTIQQPLMLQALCNTIVEDDENPEVLVVLATCAHGLHATLLLL